MLEKVTVDRKLCALIIRNTVDVKSSTFFSPRDLNLQIAIFKRKKNFVELPHYHKQIARKINRVEQFLFITKGQMVVDFFNQKKLFVKSKRLGKGDGILIISGTHSVRITRSCKAISIKQGPFLGDLNDKVDVKINDTRF